MLFQVPPAPQAFNVVDMRVPAYRNELCGSSDNLAVLDDMISRPDIFQSQLVPVGDIFRYDDFSGVAVRIDGNNFFLRLDIPEGGRDIVLLFDNDGVFFHDTQLSHSICQRQFFYHLASGLLIPGPPGFYFATAPAPACKSMTAIAAGNEKIFNKIVVVAGCKKTFSEILRKQATHKYGFVDPQTRLSKMLYIR